MKYVLFNKTLTGGSITAPAKSEWVDVGSIGGETVAFVMTASAASSPNTANITLEGSIDGTNAFSVGSAVNVTANGSYAVGSDQPIYKLYRVSYAIASGSYTSTLKCLVKGDKAG